MENKNWREDWKMILRSKEELVDSWHQLEEMSNNEMDTEINHAKNDGTETDISTPKCPKT